MSMWQIKASSEALSMLLRNFFFLSLSLCLNLLTFPLILTTAKKNIKNTQHDVATTQMDLSK